MKVGTIVLLAIGIIAVGPAIQMPAITQFAFDGTGPAFAGSLFPFLFITIACGALSGFHALITSGTTPKLIEKESQTRIIGYGGMLTEIVRRDHGAGHRVHSRPAPVLRHERPRRRHRRHPGDGGRVRQRQLALTGPGGAPLPPYDPNLLAQAAKDVGEKSIISRTGGAPTLAIGMAEVMHRTPILNLLGDKAFWYHFAIMFEALFILTTVDAGTRVARFMLSDAIGNIPGLDKFSRPVLARRRLDLLGDRRPRAGAAILYMGVTDPLGGINTLFPLFGIANQLLAGIALCVVFAIVMQEGPVQVGLDPGVPLVWVLIVTMTASFQKIFSSDPKIGYWTLHNAATSPPRRRARSTFRRPRRPRTDRRRHPQHVHPGHPVDRLRGAGARSCSWSPSWCAVKAVKAGGLPTSEEEPAPSRASSPRRAFFPTPLEKEVLAEWKDAGLDPTPIRAHH